MAKCSKVITFSLVGKRRKIRQAAECDMLKWSFQRSSVMAWVAQHLLALAVSTASHDQLIASAAQRYLPKPTIWISAFNVKKS